MKFHQYYSAADACMSADVEDITTYLNYVLLFIAECVTRKGPAWPFESPDLRGTAAPPHPGAPHHPPFPDTPSWPHPDTHTWPPPSTSSSLRLPCLSLRASVPAWTNCPTSTTKVDPPPGAAHPPVVAPRGAPSTKPSRASLLRRVLCRSTNMLVTVSNMKIKNITWNSFQLHSFLDLVLFV